MFYWRWFNRPRHPLLRLLLAVVGAMLLVGVLMLGFFALLAFAFIGTIVAITRAVVRSQHPRAPGATTPSGNVDPHVIEGEFVVLRNDSAAIKN